MSSVWHVYTSFVCIFQASKSPGLTARQAKRKDWWKVRRAKSKAEGWDIHTANTYI